MLTHDCFSPDAQTGAVYGGEERYDLDRSKSSGLCKAVVSKEWSSERMLMLHISWESANSRLHPRPRVGSSNLLYSGLRVMLM